MKKIERFEKSLYNFRIFIFICHLLVLFLTITNILQTGLVGYLLLIFDAIYSVFVVLELLHKNKERYDLSFNVTQLLVIMFLITVCLNFYVNFYMVYNNYIRNNYLVICLLLIMLIGYRYLLFKAKGNILQKFKRTE